MSYISTNDARIDHQIETLISFSNYTSYDMRIATTGLCGTFALALYRYLIANNIDAKLALFHHMHGEPWDSWRHVAVKVGDNYYDIRGRIDITKAHQYFFTSHIYSTNDEEKLFEDLKLLTKKCSTHWDSRRYNMYMRRCNQIGLK